MQRTLESLSDGLYRTDISMGELVRKSLPYEQAIVIGRLATQYGLSIDDKEKAQEFFAKVREAINALPVVQITLALQPNATLMGLIHDWFYRTYRKFVLLEVIVNPDIVAGSIISVNGKYCDYSLSKQTMQLLEGSHLN